MAANVLKNRFGKKTAIQRVHISELLKVAPVYNEKDTTRLRTIYNSVETHHRGLGHFTAVWGRKTLYNSVKMHHQALGALEVDELSYTYIVVPSILDKLPETVQLTITEGEDHL